MDWNLFQYFYNNKDEPFTMSNPCRFDMAKLIVPDVFVEVDLIRAMATMYDSASRKIRTVEGTILVDIIPMEIVNFLGLTRQAVVDIDTKKFEQEYQLRRKHYREKEVQ